MKKRGSIVLVIASCLCMVMLGGHVRAAESLGSLGGNNAADYQPPTDNPQNVPTSNLQTTSTGLQPVPGQASVDQQKLSGVGNLQVEGTTGGVVNPNTTSIPVVKEGKNWLRPVSVFAGVLTITAVSYALLRTPNSKNTVDPNVSLDVSDRPSSRTAYPLSQKVKKKSKKKTAKKHKAKK